MKPLRRFRKMHEDAGRRLLLSKPKLSDAINPTTPLKMLNPVNVFKLGGKLFKRKKRK